MKKQMTRICPKCGSGDIEYKPTSLEAATGRVPFTMKCNNCGFESKMIAEKKIKLKKAK